MSDSKYYYYSLYAGCSEWKCSQWRIICNIYERCVCRFLLLNMQLPCFDTSVLESKVHTYIHKLAASGDVGKIKEVLAENPTLVR